MKEIYLGAALLYLAAFTLMCLFVKEGRYPPPPPRRDGPGLLSAAKTYFRECFSIPFYVLLFVKTALWSLSNTIGLFSVFFAQDLGLSLEQIGKINAYTGLLTVVLMYPMGWLSDRFHPMRMYLLSMLLTIPMTVLSFFLIHGLVSYTALSMIKVPIGALMSATSLPLVMLLFPKDRFGQFASAQAMVNAAVVVAGNFAAGKFMDWIGDYRYLWVWMFFFEVLALLFMLLVYRGWQRHGGREHYQSP